MALVVNDRRKLCRRDVVYASNRLRLVWLEKLGEPKIQGLASRKNRFPEDGVIVQKFVPNPLVMA